MVTSRLAAFGGAIGLVPDERGATVEVTRPLA